MTAEAQFHRVVVIGPVPPFRGGIAQHTAMLGRALSEVAETMIVSFARQYPSWLFPGASDRDPDAAPLEDPTPHFTIDTLNPLTWRKAIREIAAYAPDLVVIPWWTFFLAPCFYYLAGACRRRGWHVRFFCHNVVDHEAAWWKLALARFVLTKGSSYVTHTRPDAANLRRMVPAAEVFVHPHPIYDQFPPSSRRLPRRAARELLFFGLVRPYKGLDVLIEAMGRLKGEDVALSVVGEFWDGRDEAGKRIRELGLDDRIELVPRYVSDAEAADYFARADAVVLPYRNATGSGVVALAFHYDKPVIASRVGGLADVVVDGSSGYLVPPGDPEALAAAIRRLNQADLDGMGRAISALKGTLSWAHLARTIVRHHPETASTP